MAKIYTNIKNLKNDILKQKKNKKIIGHCHGCFDIIHWGHILHFKSAKKKCDFLIVSITDDKFVKKGPGRPFFSSKERQIVLSQVIAIDAIIISRSNSSLNLIKNFKPHFYFKGVEYKPKNQKINPNFFKEKRCVEKNLGKIYFTKDATYSSTKVYNKILNL